MDPLVAASLVSGGSGIVSGLLNNHASAEAAEEAGKQAKDLWKMQAEYNTPANQVARLRAAGLNPNLIYGSGSGSTGNMSSAPAMTEPAKKDYSFLQAVDKVGVYLQMKNLQKQNENLSATNKNLNAQTSDINAQTRQRNAQAAYDEAVVDFYNKHGYFPGQTSAPSSLISEIKKEPLVQRSGEALGQAVGNVVGHFSSSYDSDPDRGVKMAVKAADKKGLTGQARVDYINTFVNFYNKTH